MMARKPVPLLILVITALLFNQVKCAAHTDDPDEKQAFNFFYMPHTHSFIAASFTRITMSCYVSVLTENEKLSVHTHDGMRALEMKILSNILNAIPAKPEDLDPRDVQTCDNLRHQRTVVLYKVQ